MVFPRRLWRTWRCGYELVKPRTKCAPKRNLATRGHSQPKIQDGADHDNVAKPFVCHGRAHHGPEPCCWSILSESSSSIVCQCHYRGATFVHSTADLFRPRPLVFSICPSRGQLLTKHLWLSCWYPSRMHNCSKTGIISVPTSFLIRSNVCKDRASICWWELWMV
jgi:hypothetical protein